MPGGFHRQIGAANACPICDAAPVLNRSGTERWRASSWATPVETTRSPQKFAGRLMENAYDSVFLEVDPDSGIKAALSLSAFRLHSLL